MLLVAVGKMKPGPEADLLARYRARLRPALAISEVPDGYGDAGEIMRREAVAILKVLPDQACAVALDEHGALVDSIAFATQLRGWQEAARPIAFIIGGANGLDRSILQRADVRLSLGKLTWPHMLIRPMLAEQIFRAQSIQAGHPYHRATL